MTCPASSRKNSQNSVGEQSTAFGQLPLFKPVLCTTIAFFWEPTLMKTLSSYQNNLCENLFGTKNL